MYTGEEEGLEKKCEDSHRREQWPLPGIVELIGDEGGGGCKDNVKLEVPYTPSLLILIHCTDDGSLTEKSLTSFQRYMSDAGLSIDL